jgi:hypothetical protein
VDLEMNYVKFWVMEDEKLICDKCKSVIEDGFVYILDFNEDTGLSNELVCENCFFHFSGLAAKTYCEC